MRLNVSENFLFASRNQTAHSLTRSKALERLATGRHINSASDDAAGLAISVGMSGRMRSLNQNIRNMNDGISLLQTADGALEEVANMLVRGRELAVQASTGTLSASNRAAVQTELAQLLQEIDRIAEGTQFNGINILNAAKVSTEDMDAILTALKSSWLQASEALIAAQYGLTGDGATLRIVLDQNPGPFLAYVSGFAGAGGKVVNQELHIDVQDFLPATLPNGGNAPMYDDRIIAHEMVHAVMGRTMNFVALSTWFKEGAAEFIHGADERLAADITNAGGGAAGRNAVVAAINGPWVSDSRHYSAGYAAVKYMDSQIAGGIQAVLNHLNTNAGSTLSQALSALSGGTYADEAAFLADFNANGAAYIAGLNLGDADTGSVGGGTATSVVPDLGGPATDDPLTGFTEIWPTAAATPSTVAVQIGADSGDTFELRLAAAGASDLGLSGVDVTVDARDAIDRFDAAIKTLSSIRGDMGADLNRLGHMLATAMNEYENLAASNSRILDADAAEETARLTRSDILLQASTALMSNIMNAPRYALSLLAA
ncbi:flagellinolysin [Geobacter sp. DSM 9736]|uniref:flagellinolysin n=1 Tax=Geobacter sp. DSM 9736 TaxID=1277350 RepID=UPI000B506DB3|nr:flagellinolysin [Geobacter sp. DSM 9736]SNB45175.1 flagellin [Geobacter sp. DSM 9736]